MGDYELCYDHDPDVSPAGREFWRDLLLPLGKDPGDVQRVVATACRMGEAADEVAEPAFTLKASRVEGVPARDYTERVALEGAGPLPAYMRAEWRVVDSREVYSLTMAPPEVLVQFFTEMTAEQGIELTEEQWTGILADSALLAPDVGLHLYPTGEVLYFIAVNIVEEAEDMPTLAEILAELP